MVRQLRHPIKFVQATPDVVQGVVVAMWLPIDAPIAKIVVAAVEVPVTVRFHNATNRASSQAVLAGATAKPLVSLDRSNITELRKWVDQPRLGRCVFGVGTGHFAPTTKSWISRHAMLMGLGKPGSASTENQSASSNSRPSTRTLPSA